LLKKGRPAVSKFIVLDHFLESAEGHNLQYDVELLRAAERRGWQGVLVASKRLAGEHPSLERCHVYRSFETGERDYRLLVKLSRVERKLAGTRKSTRKLIVFRKIRYQAKCWYFQRLFHAALNRYGATLDRIQACGDLSQDDHLILPTTMLVDVAGIAGWARNNSLAAEINWHFNFHFPLVNIETWYSQSCRQSGKFLILWPHLFKELCQVLPRERLHLYTTSEAMADQLHYFLNESFQVLPYPVDPVLVAARADSTFDLICGDSSPAGQGRKLIQVSR
jgi:hypothetical protein